jgi:FAR1 DNA-binding domain-containing protein
MAFELPEEGEYISLTRAESVLREHAKCHGYALSRASLKKDKRTPPTIRRRDLRCSRGGKKRGEGVKRNTGTRMTECTFEIRIHRTEYDTWQVRIHNPTHNHEPSGPSEHSQYRQPTIEERTTIQSLHASGVAPRFIVSTLLEQNPDTAVTSREVYNEIAKAKKKSSTH